MDNDYIDYLNVMLLIIILLNTSVLALKYIEEFSTELSEYELRPCSLYLTDEIGLCNRLEQFYKMSDAQLEIYLKKIEGNVDETSYNLVRYIKNNKKTMPMNACKINLNNLKEVHKRYGYDEIYPYKTINKVTTYDETTLSGFCFKDLRNLRNSRDLTRIDNTNLHTVLQNDVCSNNAIDLQNGLKFLKLSCVLENNILKINKLQILQYIDKKFEVLFPNEQQNVINNLLTLGYKKRQVIYDNKDTEVSCYKFVFDVCNQVESYSFPGLITFSLADLKIPNKIIEHNVVIDCDSSQDMKDISGEINRHINKIFDDNNILTKQIQIYDENMEQIEENYKKLQGICEEYVDSAELYHQCKKELDYRLSQYQILENEKKFLKDQLDAKQYSYMTLIETSKKIRNTVMSLDEINAALENGIPVDYDKYSLLLSNDDCIYLQVS